MKQSRFEMPVVPQLVKSLPLWYILGQKIKSLPSQSIPIRSSLIVSFYVLPDLLVSLFPLGFPAKNYCICISPLPHTHATLPDHLVFITVTKILVVVKNIFLKVHLGTR